MGNTFLHLLKKNLNVENWDIARRSEISDGGEVGQFQLSRYSHRY